MSAWDDYTNRVNLHGSSTREIAYRQTFDNLCRKLPGSLSYHENVLIDNIARSAVIIDSDNLDEKTILSLPGEDIDCGADVQWMGNHWLVVEKDANIEMYAKAKLWQCNHLLRWIDDDHIMHEQWCIIEDGTKLRVLVSA